MISYILAEPNYDYASVYFYVAFAVLFTGVSLGASFLVRPSKPTVEKNLTYECGEDPVGGAWFRMNLRFYVIALVFVLFDVEMVFVYPIASMFQSVRDIVVDAEGGLTAGIFVFFELFLFVGILFLALIYAWVKGDLHWVRPDVRKLQNEAATAGRESK
ncbi:MAG: NADH-quinone oxidoreductase subunit A [Planctomycetes bacterium]|nr:NADH-quinone oxidoreductase subunit A [Planctomycetota bacterium]